MGPRPGGAISTAYGTAGGARLAGGMRGISPLYLLYISPISPLYLPYISSISPRYPPVYKDISFWLPEGFEPNDFFELVNRT